MSDRRDRAIVAVVGLLLLVGGGLAACLGAGVFGTARSDRYVFDPTVARWWDEGGWGSFAVVTAIGVVAVALGAFLALAQLHRNDGRQRTPTVTFAPSDGARGETTLRSAALSHNLETDLEAISDVHDARVGLFGRYPTIEMRAVLAVGRSLSASKAPAANVTFDSAGQVRTFGQVVTHHLPLTPRRDQPWQQPTKQRTPPKR
jgi:hypothetical protein